MSRTCGAIGLATAAALMATSACSHSTADGAGPAGTLPATRTFAHGQPVSLLIHCGIKYIQFDGDTWQALPPIPFIPTSTTDAATGVSTGRYTIAGVMNRTSSTEAEFVTTDDPVDVHINFELTHDPLPGCA